MEKTKRIIIGLLGLIAVSVILYTPVFAETNQENNSSFQDLIDSLKQKIEELRARIEELKVQLKERVQEMRQLGEEIDEEAKETKKEIKEELKLTRRLWRGMRGKDVFLLQEFLATDPDVYPEGLVTGYFGPLTQGAVKRFQKNMGVEQVGVVGPKTFAKINELLTEGAGSSGKVPPGLLIAPGIRKKITFIPQPLPGQKLPPGIAKKLPSPTNGNGTITPDTTAPVISEIIVTNTTVSSTQISWLTDEQADSKVWYSTSTPLDLLATSTLMISSSDLVTSHELTLFDLTASTTYYYMVSSSDEADNTATSSEQSFITTPPGNGTTTPDTTAPLISEIMATSTTASSTQITWATDEQADSKVWYSTSTPLDLLATSTLQVSSSNLVTSHEFGLSSLNASTTYYYMVSSSDTATNQATSTEQSFTTLSE